MTLLRKSTGIHRYFASEQSFCELYSPSIGELNRMHWAPLRIVQKAVQFLANRPGMKILDIGSGAGKFCLAGAYFQPAVSFSGVEQRQYLIDEARQANERLGELNVNFICRNFTQLDFSEFDAFFFYNSFFENLPGTDKIDNSLEYTKELYDYYTYYLSRKLSELPEGVRVVTYCSWDDEIPQGYRLADSQEEGLLKCWIKQSEQL